MEENTKRNKEYTAFWWEKEEHTVIKIKEESEWEREKRKEERKEEAKKRVKGKKERKNKKKRIYRLLIG